MRPFDSTGMDRAMSDQRVQRLTFEVLDQRSRRLRWNTWTVWSRGSDNRAHDYASMPPTGMAPLDVHFADGRVMSMKEYLATEAANAVRKPKKDRRRRHEGEEA